MARKTNPQLAIGYLRVSTEEQSLGPAAQRRYIEQWAAAHGVTIVAIFEDKLTGATPHDARPGMTAALATLKATGSGLLLAAKRDRLGRDDEHLGIIAALERAVDKLGARIVTADGVGSVVGASRVLLQGMSDVVASFERAVIRERTTAALAVKRARGERTGELPYGYSLASDGVHLEPNAAEQAVLARVRELRSLGLSTYKIADALAVEGMMSRAGRPFAQAQVHRMVSRQKEAA